MPGQSTLHAAVQPLPVAVAVSPALRFSDLNPLTGRPYAASRFRDLPGYAADVVTGVIGLSPREWNALVGLGEGYNATGFRWCYSIGSWLAEEVQRRGRGEPSRGVCEDCWGSCVAFDSDGSLTGALDSPVVCGCAVVS